MKELSVYRKLMFVSGTLYLAWWLSVSVTLPNAYNPILSRLLVVTSIFFALGLSFVNEWSRRNIQLLFTSCLWLVTLHYFYLFYENSGDINWVVGCYVTVIAVNLCLFSNKSLYFYSVYALCLALSMVCLLPPLKNSIFLPGLITIVFQANLGMRSRLKILKNLAASNERFQLLFNSTFEGVFVHKGRCILSANRALEEMFGFNRGELIGKDALELILPNERALIAQKMAGSDTVSYETVGLMKNGTPLEIEIHGKDFKYDSQSTRLVTVQDISVKKRAEKERIAVESMAENIRVRDEFISIASHELNTPLTSLKLQAQFTDSEIKKADIQNYSIERFSKFVTLVNKQAEKLSRLIDAMLDVSNFSTGKVILDLQKIDFAAVTRDVVDFFQAQSQKDNISLSIETPRPLFILGDQYRTEQVIENLLTNAIKYGIGGQVQVTVLAEGAVASLIVRDQGIGIATENIKRIFERFERGISSQNICGFGLGLYISKQIVEAQGGTISVESELGHGSTFKVQLPIMNYS